jgi:hypothetical protein
VCFTIVLTLNELANVKCFPMSSKFEVITVFYDMCFTSTKCFTMSSKFEVITVFYPDKTALHL